MSVVNDMNTASALADPGSQAERWFARLRAEDCTPAELRAFETWRAQSPGHARAYEEVSEAWGSLGALAEDPELVSWREEARRAAEGVAPAAVSEFRKRHVMAPQGRRRWVYALAAGVVLAVLAPWAVEQVMQPAPEVTTYATAPGEQKTLRLSDGSQLMLNTATELRVEYAHQRRDIQLVRGEAMFDVASDVRRPFHVNVAGGAVTALGTRFLVKHVQRQTAVTLLSGAVYVADHVGRQSDRLAPNERVIFDGRSWIKDRVDPELVASWTTGKLLFRSTPLSEVLAEANRYGPGRIVLADPVLGDLAVSGTFNIGQPQTLVGALQSAFGLTAVTDAAGETRLSRKN